MQMSQNLVRRRRRRNERREKESHLLRKCHVLDCREWTKCELFYVHEFVLHHVNHEHFQRKDQVGPKIYIYISF